MTVWEDAFLKELCLSHRVGPICLLFAAIVMCFSQSKHPELSLPHRPKLSKNFLGLRRKEKDAGFARIPGKTVMEPRDTETRRTRFTFGDRFVPVSTEQSLPPILQPYCSVQAVPIALGNSSF